jgi:excisionase family DNA binding protein
MSTDQELLTTREVAKLLKTAYSTLLTWRTTKRYPLKYIKVGRKVLYRRSDVMSFLESRTVE